MSSGVEFDEDKFSYSSKPQPNSAGGFNAPSQQNYQTSDATGLTGWLIRKGWVKSSTSAQVVLVVVILVNIIITVSVVKLFL